MTKAAHVPEGHVILQLSKADDLFAGVPPVSTITYLKGSLHAYQDHLKTRFRQIVNANPWLAGALATNHGKTVVVHPAEVADVDVANMLRVESDPEGGPLVMSPDFDTALKGIGKYLIPFGPKYINKSPGEAPLSRLVVLPCTSSSSASSPSDVHTAGDDEHATPTAPPEPHFAVLLCTSHALGDAHTHYKLRSMLSEGAAVQSLVATRDPEFCDQVAATIGYQPLSWQNSLAHFGHILYHLLFGPRLNIHTFTVDEEQLQERKAENSSIGDASSDVDLTTNTAAASTTVGGRSTAAKAGYVSTNDILTSDLCSLVNARLATVSVNFRGLLPAAKADRNHAGLHCHAGNYSMPVNFDRTFTRTPDDVRVGVLSLRQRASALESRSEEFSSAVSSAVSSSVTVASSGPTRSGPLPRLWSFMFDRLCVTTNWVTYHDVLELHGCEEVLHMPVFSPKLVRMAFPYDVLLVYKMRKDVVGVVGMSRVLERTDYLKKMPLKAVGESSV